jgi:hypothetical protein
MDLPAPMTEFEATKMPSTPVPPAATTPTWEMELLVSGAAIFGLLQLPALVDRAYYYALNRSSEAIASLLFPVWFYVKVSLVILIVTFVIHLCLRGYWVALVGMDSVYPGGIRWEKLRMGPLARTLHAARTPAMPVVIENADNRATRVFGIGFGMAMVLLAPIVLILFSLLVALLVEKFLGPEIAVRGVALLILAALVPMLAAVSIDLHHGARLPAGGRSARGLTRVMRFYRGSWFDGRRNLLLGLFFSHEGRQRAMATAGMFLLPILSIVVIDLVVSQDGFQLGSHAGWPDADLDAERSSPSAFYASLRGSAWQGQPTPFVPDRVVRGAYLPLFVPFVPNRHQPAMSAQCPEFSGRRADPGTGKALDCLALISDIRIDGKSVPVSFEASSDPATGQPGMLAMLPMQDLPGGRHELSLNQPTRPKGKAKPPKRYRIPFWK